MIIVETVTLVTKIIVTVVCVFDVVVMAEPRFVIKILVTNPRSVIVHAHAVAASVVGLTLVYV